MITILLIVLLSSIKTCYCVDNNVPIYCNDDKLLQYIQKDQFRLAKNEIMLSSDNQRLWKNYTNLIPKQKDLDDFIFYSMNFGIVVLDLEESSHINVKTKQLAYYRIYKNGNDNIRAHLYRYATMLEGGPLLKPGFEHACCSIIDDDKNPDQFSCSLDKCRHQYLQMINAAGVNNQVIPLKSITSRYPFTFTRDPIARFVSGYTEIEYRLSVKKNFIHYLPLFSRVGTIERFKEFIRMIINSEGSHSLFRNRNTELEHIAPQIGVIFSASKVEKKKLNIYQLEKFKDEWARLSKESGLPELLDSLDNDQLASHHSSKDPNGTKSAAYKLLNPALNKATTCNSSTNISSMKETDDLLYNISYHYLRAICRIYLPDFTCLHHDLPQACYSILDDVKISIDHYNDIQEKLHKNIVNRLYINNIIPYYILEYIATSVCYILLASSPECYYRTLTWLKGNDYNDNDDDDN